MDFLIEEWRPVVGYESMYEVSSLGRVRSMPRMIMRRNGIPMMHKGKIRKLTRDRATPRNGNTVYLVVSLVVGGKSIVRPVHQLVLEAFVGPRIEGMECRHLNGVASDNRVTNLSYGTSRENKLDCVSHGTHGMARKTHCKQGHPFSEENTYIAPHNGARGCRECRRFRRKAWVAAHG